MRRVLWWLALLTFAPIVAAVVARMFRLEWGPLVIVVAFMPWITFACLVPFVLAALARSLPLAIGVTIVTIICAAWMIPLYTFEGGGTPALTVASINTQNGKASAAEIVDMVSRSEVTVLAVQELTPDEVQALTDAGIETYLPISYVRPADDFGGIGVWSKYPMTAKGLSGFVANTIQATVTAPSGDINLIAVHIAAPGLTDHTTWRDDMTRLEHTLAQQLGSTMVIGDLNATRDNAPLLSIEGLDYKDAADEAAAGFSPTFPDSRTPFPLVAIDHVLTRDTPLRARAFDTYSITGADHRAIVVQYGTAGAID
jgi:endonuclease/exonuclease/phosphatase (EEP) superfamily protein YafD